ncbi:hypothetical protein [Chryseobacterium culicis]|uniref:hypothetical protein n=1 Tax=Chryseobacterium culicis TaxID=680127 RepID=UPI002897B571|nr:hypothetical protein [Chryseobacterium culicis]
MPDTSYYIDDHSRVKLFDYILSLNGKIIPDLNYSDENFIIISCSDQFLDFIDHKTVRFFIISDKFSEEELVMKKNRFSETPIYNIVQRMGGPYIDFALYRGFSESAKVPFKRTDIGYYTKFLDKNDLSIEHITNNNVKVFYNEMIKFVRGMCDMRQVDGKKYYIDKSLK